MKRLVVCLAALGLWLFSHSVGAQPTNCTLEVTSGGGTTSKAKAALVSLPFQGGPVTLSLTCTTGGGFSVAFMGSLSHAASDLVNCGGGCDPGPYTPIATV